ncbi:MAG: PAS domain S-box protein [Rugosibacter sp.]|jgi:PAS domain S-box-containing protein|nr:hypothetical protein [Rugosibacter sp.]
MALHQALIEQTDDAFIFSDPNGKIQLWNHGAELLFGLTAHETIGQLLDIIIPEHLRRAHWMGFQKAVASGRMALGDKVMTTRFLHRDGGKRYADMRFNLIKDSDGHLLGVLATARDSTDRHLAERALREQIAALTSAQEAQNRP